MRIDRCICYNATFRELRSVARRTGSTSVEALQQHHDFGMNCRLCHPYVQEMLHSGETVFHRVIKARQDTQ